MFIHAAQTNKNLFVKASSSSCLILNFNFRCHAVSSYVWERKSAVILADGLSRLIDKMYHEYFRFDQQSIKGYPETQSEKITSQLITAAAQRTAELFHNSSESVSFAKEFFSAHFLHICAILFIEETYREEKTFIESVVFASYVLTQLPFSTKFYAHPKWFGFFLFA